MKRPPLVSILMAPLFVTACASVVNPKIQGFPQTSGIAAFENAISNGTPAREWWRALGDPTLDSLVVESVEHNFELRAALAAVKAARSLADAAARDALPAGRLDAQAQLQRPSTSEVDPYKQNLPRPPSSKITTISQGLTWEVDLFGRVGTAIAVADRHADIAASDMHAATALLQAEVVRQYTGLRLQQQTIKVLLEELATYEARVKQLFTRSYAGLADRREALVAQGELARMRSERAQAEAFLHAHLAALSVMAGRNPHERSKWREALLVIAPLPEVPNEVSVVMPSDLLARRPDVVRAEAQLRAALGEAVLAERAHLPRISLNLALGLNAPFGELGNANAMRYAAGPVLSWEWLDAGRIKARAAAARAGQEAAYYGLEQTMLKALQDSEIALHQWVAVISALKDARLAKRSASDSEAYTRARVIAGLEAPLAGLESNIANLHAQRLALTVHTEALQAYGQTQLALAAWQPEPQLTSVK